MWMSNILVFNRPIKPNDIFIFTNIHKIEKLISSRFLKLDLFSSEIEFGNLNTKLIIRIFDKRQNHFFCENEKRYVSICMMTSLLYLTRQSSSSKFCLFPKTSHLHWWKWSTLNYQQNKIMIVAYFLVFLGTKANQNI